MRYLLDTNIIAELYRKHPDKKVIVWIENIHPVNLYMSCITVGELRSGALKKLKKDKVSGEVLLKWVERLVNDYAEQIIDINLDTAEIWAELISRDNTNAIDALIAAQAKQENMVLVTRNVKHFCNYDVRILNPFELSIKKEE